MKKKETIRGYLYYFFPVDFVIQKNEVELTDCWFNNNFLWLLHFVDNILEFLCYLVGIQKWLSIRFYGQNKRKIIELSKKSKK